jgi:hypothetical protein
MAKKVRQTITIDVDRLDSAFIWHLNLEEAIKKISRLSQVARLNKEEILKIIKESRYELTSLDMTLSEFQEMYEALTGQEPTPNPVPPPEPELLQEDLQKQIDKRMIGNLLLNIDKSKK